MTTLHAIANWLYHVLGLKGTGPWYGNWSGWFADVILPASIFGGVLTYLRHVNCHDGGEFPHGCKRMGHPVEGTPFRACRSKHHPVLSQHPKITAEIMAREHAARQELLSAQHKLLNEIHRHVTASAPAVGDFPPES